MQEATSFYFNLGEIVDDVRILDESIKLGTGVQLGHLNPTVFSKMMSTGWLTRKNKYCVFWDMNDPKGRLEEALRTEQSSFFEHLPQSTQHL